MITIKPMQKGDVPRLFQFEQENKAYFEKMVPPRPEAYNHIDSFRQVVDDLIKEQEAGQSLFYIIETGNSSIAGRINLTDICDGTGNLGYRIGIANSGQGIASEALRRFLKEAENQGMTAVNAKTLNNNKASRRILEKNGFVQIHQENNFFQFNGEDVCFVHFCFDVPRTVDV